MVRVMAHSYAVAQGSCIVQSSVIIGRLIQGRMRRAVVHNCHRDSYPWRRQSLCASRSHFGKWRSSTVRCHGGRGIKSCSHGRQTRSARSMWGEQPHNVRNMIIAAFVRTTTAWAERGHGREEIVVGGKRGTAHGGWQARAGQTDRYMECRSLIPEEVAVLWK